MVVLRKVRFRRLARSRSSPQQVFSFRTWGGKRNGAGRPKRSRETVAHRMRPTHSRHRPLHITVRMVKSAPDLREDRVVDAVRRVFAKRAKEVASASPTTPYNAITFISSLRLRIAWRCRTPCGVYRVALLARSIVSLVGAGN